MANVGPLAIICCLDPSVVRLVVISQKLSKTDSLFLLPSLILLLPSETPTDVPWGDIMVL